MSSSIKTAVQSRIASLNIQEGKDFSPSTKATLARLRHAVSEPLGAHPELFNFFYRGLDKPDLNSKEEQAVFDALCLFALHQQGCDALMHQSDINLGSALASLQAINGESYDDSAVLRRVNSLMSSNSSGELVVQLRHIIPQLRKASVLLDYAQLATDLYYYNSEKGRMNTRLSWSRKFYSIVNDNQSQEKGQE